MTDHAKAAGQDPDGISAVIEAESIARRALAASPETPEAGIEVERLAEMHWWLVTGVNSTDERFLELLDWLEPRIPDDVADRMDARLASREEGER